MKLYMIPACPFVQRVLIAQRLRGISQSTLPSVEIDLNNPPEAVLSINPTGSVPTVELTPGNGFNESHIIMEFLDSLEAQGPRLYGDHAATIAQTKVSIERASEKLLNPLMQAMYSRGNINAVRKAKLSLSEGYAWLNSALKKSGGSYLGNTRLNAVDVSLAPFIIRAQWLFRSFPELQPNEATPECKKYFQSLCNHPDVVATLPSNDVMEVTAQRFLAPHPLLQKVIDAPRVLCENPAERVAQAEPKLNHWKVERDEHGFCLQAKFNFKNHTDAVQKLAWLHDAQETTDHHTSILMRDFTTAEITLVTHEPRWGITEKDLTLAIAIETYFSEGQLP